MPPREAKFVEHAWTQSQETHTDSVSCPGDLATDVAASITCAVTKGQETRGVTVSVAAVDNGQVKFTMTMAQQWFPGAAERHCRTGASAQSVSSASAISRARTRSGRSSMMKWPASTSSKV